MVLRHQPPKKGIKKRKKGTTFQENKGLKAKKNVLRKQFKKYPKRKTDNINSNFDKEGTNHKQK